MIVLNQSSMQEDAEEHMLRLGNEQMSEADSPRAHALALLMALLDRGGDAAATDFLTLAPQLPVSLCLLIRWRSIHSP